MKATLGKSVVNNPQVLASRSEEPLVPGRQIRAGTAKTSLQDNLVSNIAGQINRNLHTTAIGGEVRSNSTEELARNALDAAIRVLQTDFKSAVDTIGTIGLDGLPINDFSNYIVTAGEEPKRD
jgi:hypothetical protein